MDTPPPTVSGSIHMGTLFGYTQTDAITRFQRMTGKAVFFPIGWDDNGLATERRVQNFYGVRCDPTSSTRGRLPPPFRGDAPKDHARDPGVEPELRPAVPRIDRHGRGRFEAMFRRLGVSLRLVAAVQTSATQPPHQSAAFLHNLARGEAYSAEAPTVWDVDDRPRSPKPRSRTASNRAPTTSIAFHGPDGDVLSTRLDPSCWSAAWRWWPTPTTSATSRWSAGTVRTPMFDVEVPVVAHPLAQPDKGTGIAMVCTFGDTTDVTWWRELDLPDPQRDRARRAVDGGDAGMARRDRAGVASYERSQVTRSSRPRPPMVELLKRVRRPARGPRPITHPVKFYERGSRPLEIVTSRQWYIRNGGRDQASARRSWPAARSSTGTRTTCATATTTGSRGSTATG